MKSIERREVLRLASGLPLVLVGCAQPASDTEQAEDATEAIGDAPAAADAFEPPLEGEPLDYANDANWLVRPTERTHEVDAIFLYATAAVDLNDNASELSEVGGWQMRQGAEASWQRDGMVLATSCDVFVPLWRQATLATERRLDHEAYVEFLHGLPRTDVFCALDHFFEQESDERPFVLAGHGQGSALLNLVLKEYLAARPELMERMVCAYQIGYSLTADDLASCPWLRRAERADDVGVVVSFTTEGERNVEEGAASIAVREGALAINPISWTTTEEVASEADNLGSYMTNTGTGERELIVPGVADARVNQARGVVVTTTATAWPATLLGVDPEPYGPESYHDQDYAFYYKNLEANVAQRIEAFRAGA